jgi:hypothetical protein
MEGGFGRSRAHHRKHAVHAHPYFYPWLAGSFTVFFAEPELQSHIFSLD